MKLSAPIHLLKRKAKLLSRDENIPLHEALDRIAAREGFSNWSLLAAKRSAPERSDQLFSRLKHGDLLLLGARPGQGKTLMSLKLAVEAMKAGNRAIFFTLGYTERDVLDRFRAIGADPAQFDGLFEFDGSDSICADYMIAALSGTHRGDLVIVDYLQLLDQKRQNPELTIQVRGLRSFTRERGLIMVCLSQIDRTFDPSKKRFQTPPISGPRVLAAVRFALLA